MFITRYYKTGVDAPSKGTETLSNPAADIRKMIADKGSKMGEPRFWGFTEWGATHNKAGFKSASAVTLEFRVTHMAKQIETAIASMGFHCYAFNTEVGRAYAFPLSSPATFGGYTKIAAALAEMVGADVTNGTPSPIGLVVSCGSPTYLFEPAARSQFVEYGGLDFDISFIDDLNLVGINIAVWTNDPTKMVVSTASGHITGYQVRDANGALRVQIGSGIISETGADGSPEDRLRKIMKLKSPAKAAFDDLFDKTEEVLKSVVVLQSIVKTIRDQQQG